MFRGRDPGGCTRDGGDGGARRRRCTPRRRGRLRWPAPEQINLRVPTAIVLGHEARVVSILAGSIPRSRSTSWVTIPMHSTEVDERRHGRHRALARSRPPTPDPLVSATDLVASADELVTSGRETVDAAASIAELDDAERGAAGKTSPLNEIREAIKSFEPADRAAVVKPSRRRGPRSKPRLADRRSALRRVGSRGVPRGRSPRPHHRRPRLPARAPPSGHARLARARRRVRGHGLPRRRRSRSRARLVQLRSTQLPARPSCSRHARHPVREARRAGRGHVAHAHLAGAGARDGDAGTADLCGRARPRVPARTRSTRATRRSSIRSNVSPSTAASRSAICSARSRCSCTRYSVPTSAPASTRRISRSPSRRRSSP